MRREHKIGIAVTCAFLCLTGTVIGLKMREQPVPQLPDEPMLAQALPHSEKEPPGNKEDSPHNEKINSQISSSSGPPAAQEHNEQLNPLDPLPRERSTAFDSTKKKFQAEHDNPEDSHVPPPIKPEPTTPPPSLVEAAETDKESEVAAKDNDKNKDKENTAASAQSGEPFPSGMLLTGGSDSKNRKPPAADGATDAHPPQLDRDSQPPPSPSANIKPPTSTPAPFSGPLPISMPSEALGNNAPPSKPDGMKPATPSPSSPSSPSPVMASPPTAATTPAESALLTPPGGASGGPASLVGTPPSSIPERKSAAGNPGDPPPVSGNPPPSPLTSMERPADANPTNNKPAPLPPSPIGTAPVEATLGAPAPLTPPTPPPSASSPPPSFAPISPPSASPAPPPPTPPAPLPAGNATPPAAMPAPVPFPQAPPSTPSTSAADPERVKPTPAASAAPLAKPAPRTEPQVIVFTEKEYQCQANDSFATLSKRFYGTEKYAAALQRHNQNHARASYQMASSGKIAPGETLFIPPPDILEQRYPDTVGKSPPASSAVPASFNGASMGNSPPSFGGASAGGPPPSSSLAPVPSSAAPPLVPINSPPTPRNP